MYFSFYVGMLLLRTVVTTPIYVYLLELEDAMLTLTGLLVTVGGSLVMGLATKVKNSI